MLNFIQKIKDIKDIIVDYISVSVLKFLEYFSFISGSVWVRISKFQFRVEVYIVWVDEFIFLLTLSSIFGFAQDSAMEP